MNAIQSLKSMYRAIKPMNRLSCIMVGLCLSVNTAITLKSI